MLLAFFLLLSLFFTRFGLSIDTQELRCLTTWFVLIDKGDHDVKRGDLVAFKHIHGAKGMPKGLMYAKFLRGVPGDKVTVRESYTIVNGERFDVSMSFGIEQFKETPSTYEREFIVPEGEYFFMGNTTTSNDSRFWGTIEQISVEGKVYAVL